MEKALNSAFSYLQGSKVKPIILSKYSSIARTIPPTANCQTHHFQPVSDKAHLRNGLFIAMLYKWFFIFVKTFSNFLRFYVPLFHWGLYHKNTFVYT